MRDIDQITVHCSATMPSMDIGVTEIDRWHKARGWDGCGYHFVIRRDGIRELGRPINKIGAHASGHNTSSIGICLVGGISDDNESVANYTRSQYESLALLLDLLTQIFNEAEVIGHRDIEGVAKDCPCYDVRTWWNKGEVENEMVPEIKDNNRCDR